MSEHVEGRRTKDVWPKVKRYAKLFVWFLGFSLTMLTIRERFFEPSACLVASVRVDGYVLPPTIGKRAREARSLSKKYYWVGTVWHVKLKNTGEIPCIGVKVRIPGGRRGRLWTEYEEKDYGDKLWYGFSEPGECFEMEELAEVGDLDPGEVVLLQVWSSATRGKHTEQDVTAYHNGGVAEVLAEDRFVGLLSWLSRHPFLFSFMIGASVALVVDIATGAPAIIRAVAGAGRTWLRLRKLGEVSGLLRYNGPLLSGASDAGEYHQLVMCFARPDDGQSGMAQAWKTKVSEHELGRAYEYSVFVREGECRIITYWDLDDSGDLSAGDLFGQSDSFTVSNRKRTGNVTVTLEPFVPREKEQDDTGHEPCESGEE